MGISSKKMISLESSIYVAAQKEFIIKKLLQFNILTVVNLDHASKKEKQEFLEHASNLIYLRFFESENTSRRSKRDFLSIT